MGNSLRQWSRSYDSRKRERAAETGASAYGDLVARITAAPSQTPATSTDDDSAPVVSAASGEGAGPDSHAAVAAPEAETARPSVAGTRPAEADAIMERYRLKKQAPANKSAKAGAAPLTAGLPAPRKRGRVSEWLPRNEDGPWMTEEECQALGISALRELVPIYYYRSRARAGGTLDDPCTSGNRAWMVSLLCGKSDRD